MDESTVKTNPVTNEKHIEITRTEKIVITEKQLRKTKKNLEDSIAKFQEKLGEVNAQLDTIANAN